jgi:hypothetical protein
MFKLCFEDVKFKAKADEFTVVAEAFSMYKTKTLDSRQTTELFPLQATLH